MRDTYQQIKQKLDQLEFPSLYVGFKPFPFALYDEKDVYMEQKTIPRDNRFIGNTAIPFESSYLAIWQLHEPPKSIEILTSKIVHEMFHANQHFCQEKRWPDEYQALNYHYIDNLGLKYKETMQLLHTLKNPSLESLKTFFSMRAYRASIYKEEVAYEEKIETVEGMAQYVELKSLQLLNNSLYQLELDKIVRILKQQEEYIPVRHISYKIGAIMMLLADQLHLHFGHQIRKTELTVTEIIRQKIHPEIVEFSVQDDNTNVMIKKYIAEKEKRVQHILKSGEDITKERMKLMGFDPLNTVKIHDTIWFNYFVMIDENGTPTPYLTEGIFQADNERNVKKLVILDEKG